MQVLVELVEVCRVVLVFDFYRHTLCYDVLVYLAVEFCSGLYMNKNVLLFVQGFWIRVLFVRNGESGRSYEEEDEEEEMLQRALAEQAAREAGARPSAARSPARPPPTSTKAIPPNRAPPPPSNTQQGGPPQRVPPGPLPPKRAPPQPPPEEDLDDDDEEVELASLSSEDEAPARRAPKPLAAAPTNVAAGYGQRGEDWDDDEDDDEDDEPSTWKPSYKTEVCVWIIIPSFY